LCERSGRRQHQHDGDGKETADQPTSHPSLQSMTILCSNAIRALYIPVNRI
jgi:hypothetical protein